jgi:hypothetical protein
MGGLAFALQLLDLVPLIVKGVTGAAEALSWGKSQIEKMVQEDRDPTDAEWDELNKKTEELRTALQTD